MSFSLSIILLSITAKNYVESETIRDYNRISALKDMRDISAMSQEIADIRDSFETISRIFSPFQIVFDNRFYSHPKVHLASNVINGGLTLAQSIEQSIAIAKAFQEELPKNEKCSLSSFFASGSIIEKECPVKVTDFLKNHKNALEEINTNLSDAVTYYAGIETLGNIYLDEKLQKNIQSLL